MQVGIRQLARAESKLETGGKASSTVLEVLGNIDAMQVAVDEAATAEKVGIEHLTAIHGKLMANAPNSKLAGIVRREQNWIGGNDYNPCGADFVPPPAEHVDSLLHDLCEATLDRSLPPVVQAAIVHAQFETIHPFDDGNGRTGRALIHVVLRRRGIATSYLPLPSVSFWRYNGNVISEASPDSDLATLVPGLNSSRLPRRVRQGWQPTISRP